MLTHLWLLLTNPAYAQGSRTVRRIILRNRESNRRLRRRLSPEARRRLF